MAPGFACGMPRLRVKDVDFDRNEIAMREGKGHKDRVTVLPASVREPLAAHLERVRGPPWARPECGLRPGPAAGCPGQEIPTSSREWGWQWVFPGVQAFAATRGTASRSASTICTNGLAEGHSCRRPDGAHRQAGRAPHPPSLLRHRTCSPRATTFERSRSSSVTRTWPRP